jgi:glutathione peroxidase
LTVIAFPCDQFAHQEPADDAEIASFCSLNFGVKFPVMAKVKVNGRGTHPVFAFLKKRSPGVFKAVKWNFTKFLVSGDGTTMRRYAPTVEPADLEPDIERLLT